MASERLGRRCEWCGRPLPADARSDVKTCPDKAARARGESPAVCRKASHRFGRRGPLSRLGGPPRRLAYADPPYPGMSGLYGEHADFGGEGDHRELVERLVDEFPDGWALSTSPKTLKHVLALVPDEHRIGFWVHPVPPEHTKFAATAGEPVIFSGGRERPPHAPPLANWIYAPQLRWQRYPGGVIGMKPPEFCWWVFDCLGAQHGDELVDLFPGSGAVMRAWQRFQSTPVGQVGGATRPERPMPPAARDASGGDRRRRPGGRDASRAARGGGEDEVSRLEERSRVDARRAGGDVADGRDASRLQDDGGELGEAA
jgi:hypothetical protein